MKKNTTIKKVQVLTGVSTNLTAYVYYASGRCREIDFNEISELPQTVQDIIVGNENTLVTENFTTFFNTNIMSDIDMERELVLSSEGNTAIIFKGKSYNEWNMLMAYIKYYTHVTFRVTEENRVFINTFENVKYFESTSKYSLIASAVTKYIDNDIIINRLEK